MSAYTIRPITDRTAFKGHHRRSQFAASWPTTERLLLNEVSRLRGRDLIIEADVVESDITNDGARIRASARPSTPAIRVAFESMYGGLVYATDTFGFWQDNVRAIALGLEALRKVDRYGITKRGEQYAGWKALTAGPSAGMSTEDARRIITMFEDQPVLGGEDALNAAYRNARRRAHPDHNEGSRDAWDLVEQAARVLGIAS